MVSPNEKASQWAGLFSLTSPYEYDEDADTKWCPSQESRTLSPVHYALTYRFTARVYLMYPLAGHDKTQVEPLVWPVVTPTCSISESEQWIWSGSGLERLRDSAASSADFYRRKNQLIGKHPPLPVSIHETLEIEVASQQFCTNARYLEIITHEIRYTTMLSLKQSWDQAQGCY